MIELVGERWNKPLPPLIMVGETLEWKMKGRGWLEYDAESNIIFFKES